MMKTETIWLQRPASDVPWGFRLRGGRDYPYPLTVQRVSPGSIAATGLAVGDVILQIADIDTCNLSFAQSQDLIKDCNNLLQFHIAKGGGKASSVPASPQPRQEQPSLQPQQPQQPQQQVASPTAAMASGVHDLFRDMYRNSEHLGTTPDPRYSPVSGAASPGQSAAYSSNMQPQQKYGNDMYSSGPRPIDIQHLGSGSRDSPRQISVQQYGRDNNSGGPRQIQIQHLGRESDQSDARYTPVQQYSNGSDSGARRINIQHIGSGGDHGSRVVPINTSPAAIDNNVYQPAQPEPPSYQNLDSQAIRVQSPIVPKTSFSASPQYPYQGSTQPEPSYPYQPAAPNSTYDAVGPYKPVSSQSSTSYGPPKSYSSDAGQAFNSSYGPQTSAPSLVSSQSAISPFSPMSVSGGQSSGQSLSPGYSYTHSAASSTSELSDLSAPSLPESKPPPIPSGGWVTPELGIDDETQEKFHTPRESPIPVFHKDKDHFSTSQTNQPYQNFSSFGGNSQANSNQPTWDHKSEQNQLSKPVSDNREFTSQNINLGNTSNGQYDPNTVKPDQNQAPSHFSHSTFYLANNQNKQSGENYQNDFNQYQSNRNDQIQSPVTYHNYEESKQTQMAAPDKGWSQFPSTMISNQNPSQINVMTTSQENVPKSPESPNKPMQYNTPTQYQNPTEYEAPSQFQTPLEGPAETVQSSVSNQGKEAKQAPPPVAPKPVNRRPPSALSVEVSTEQQPKLQRQNISSGSGGMPSSPSIGGRRTPSYAGASYGQSPSRAQAPSPGFGNVQSPTYGGVQSPTYGGVQSPRYGNTQTSTPSQQMSNPGGVQSPTYGGVQSPTYGSQTSNPVQSPTYGGVQSPTYGSQTSNPVLSPTYGSVQSPTYDSQSSNPVQSPSYGSVQSPTYGGVQSPRVYGSSREPSYGQSGPGMSSPVQNQSSQNAGTPYSPSTNTTPRPFGVQSHASDNQSVSSPSAYGPKSPSSYDPYSPRTPQGFKSVQPNLGSPSTTAPAPPFSQPYSPSTGPTSPGRSPMAPSVNSPGTPMGQTQGPQFNQYTPTSPGTQPPSMGQSSQYAPGTSPSLNQTNLQNNQYDSNPPGAPDIYSLQQPPQSYGTDNGSSPGGPPPAPPVPSVPSPKPVSPTPPKPRPSSRNDNLQRPSSQTEHRIPDAVLNMAARGPPEKKPFTYAPSADIIKEQRDKVRRKPGSAALPRYQNLLNMPSFDDSTPTVQKVPQSPTAQAVNQAELPRDGMVAHAQYNSPLNVYSDNAVGETFAAQTGGAVNVTPQRQGSKPGDQDVTQSPTYRMLHGMDPGKGPGNRVLPQEPEPEEDVGNYDEASIRYRGGHIPSKSFKILQNMTGGSELPPRPTSRNKSRERELDGPDYPAPQHGADMSYGGAHIPSKSFRYLQQSIGDDGSPIPDTGTSLPPDGSQGSIDRRRPRRRPRSRSAQRAPPPSGGPPPPRTMTPNRDLDDPEPQRDFDERAYLSGRVAILRDPSEIPAKPYKEIIETKPRGDDSADQEAKHFDEQAFLQGKVPILGNEQQREWVPKVKEDETPIWAKKVQSKKGSDNFQDPLARRGSRDVVTPDWAARAPSREGNVDGPSIAVDELGYLITAPKSQEEEKPEWARKAEEKKFDEARILAAKAEAAKGNNEIDPKWKRHVQRRESLGTVAVDELGYLVNPAKGQGRDTEDRGEFPKVLQKSNQGKLDVDELGYLKTGKPEIDTSKKADWQVTLEKKKGQKMFDDRGNLIVDPGTEPEPAPGPAQQEAGDEPEENVRPFDERAFLMGRIPLVKGGEADLSNLPPPRTTKKPHVDEREEEERLKRPFDEQAFLSGNVSITGGCLEGGNKPPRSSRRGRRFRERAPWERPNGGEDDGGVSSDAEFDERAFLRGKVPLVRQSSESELLNHGGDGFSRIPSKTFRRLSRSVSREASREGTPDSGNMSGNLSMRRTQSDDRGAESDTGEAYSSMYYKGKNIPSRTFMKLQRNVRTRQPAREPMPFRDKEQEGIDVDKHLETMSIGQHDPGKYMEQLKQHAESTNGNAKVGEIKFESKPVESKPVESSKPAEIKVESKPVESKPAEIKVESKAVESKPAEIRVESKQVESKPAEIKVESKPVVNKPAQSNKVESQHAESKESQKAHEQKAAPNGPSPPAEKTSATEPKKENEAKAEADVTDF